MNVPIPAPDGRPSSAARVFGLCLASIGGLGLLACLLLPVLAVLSPKKYRASALMEVHQNPPESTKLFPGTNNNTTGEEKHSAQKISKEEFLSSQIKFIRSAEILSAVVRKQNLSKRWNADTPDAALIKLQQMIQITRDRATNLLRVTVASTDKKEVAELANDLVQAYTERRKRLAQDELDRDIQKIFADHSNQQKFLAPPTPSKVVTIHEIATEPATYSSPRVKFWLAAALAGIPCSGLALGSGLWLRRRAAAMGQ